MAGEIIINTGEVVQIADHLDSLNKQLREELEKGKNAINNLSSSWEGEASQATIASFNEFSAKYFQQYEDVLNQYVRFLRENIAQGYFETETANTTLADSFK